jgi:hypothetical protein
MRQEAMARMYTPLWLASKLLGEGAIIRVNPQKISYRASSPSHINRFISGYGSKIKWKAYLVSREWANFAVSKIHNLEDISEGRQYTEMLDVWRNRADLHNSAMYQKAYRKIKSGKHFQYKGRKTRRLDEIDELINSTLMDVLYSLESHGYIEEKRSSYSDSQMGRALIDQDGKIVPTRRARHRLAAAKIVGVDRGFPLHVEAIHVEYLKQRQIFLPFGWKDVPELIQSAADQ